MSSSHVRVQSCVCTCVATNAPASVRRVSCDVAKCSAHWLFRYAPSATNVSPAKSVLATSQYAAVAVEKLLRRRLSSTVVATYIRGFSLSMYVCEPTMEMALYTRMDAMSVLCTYAKRWSEIFTTLSVR